MKRDNKGRFIKGSNGNTYKGFGIWYDYKGYACIFINGKSILLHVFIWEQEYGEKPKGYEIHHINGNKKDYKLSNLKLLTKSDHRKIHAGWKYDCNNILNLKPCKICKKLLSLDNFYDRKGMTPTNVCKKCLSKEHKKKLKTDKVYREKRRLYLKEYYKKNKQEILLKQQNKRNEDSR